MELCHVGAGREERMKSLAISSHQIRKSVNSKPKKPKAKGSKGGFKNVNRKQSMHDGMRSDSIDKLGGNGIKGPTTLGFS